ncbi:hypothetical protein MtrunA17_Chr4g0020071 [Medicago truncatula]|uniref:Uncharacterized protein n=1 Tax=Medicago truncatula TaxID=3880 RepID=A0A396I2X3_MEDTR|nr:hypothetical protein MtrunA17_Chr4g0020071 [Medicago truncatula]
MLFCGFKQDNDSLLKVLIGELQSKAATLVDPNSKLGETRT